jgi:putative aldouronate transport system substrate-binding protein
MALNSKKLSRRQLLRAAGLAAAGTVAAACAPQATSTPEVVEVTKVVEKVSTQIVEVTPTVVPQKTYKVTFWEHSPWTTAALGTPEEDFVYQYLLKTYGLDVTIQPAPSTDADTKLNASIAAGEIPDVIQSYWGPSSTVAQALVDQGVLVPVEDYLADTAYLQTYLTANEWVYLTLAGKKYALAQPRPFSNWLTLWTRTDWLEKLNLSTPTTIDELTEVAKAFTTMDPDGNGKADTYGFTGYKDGSGVPYAGMESVFAPFGAWPAHNNVMVENNQVVFTAFSDYAKNALTWWSTQVKAGLVDPDWVVHTVDTWRNAVAQQRVGIVTAEFQFLREGSSNANLGQILSEANPNAAWDQLAAVQGPYGAYVNWMGTPVDTSFWFTRQAESEPGKMEAIMRWFNDAMNPDSETYRLMVYGQPGRQYVMDAEGRRTQRFSPPELAWQNYWVVVRRGDEGYFYYYRNEANSYFASEANGKLADRQVFSISQPQINTVDSLIAAHPKMVDLLTYMREKHLKFGTGDLPMDQWDAFIDEAKKTYDLQEIVDDATEQLKKLGLVQ